jgi:hypothetical protein
MRMKVGQSVVERLLYMVLLLTFVITGVFYFQARSIINELKSNQATEQTGITTLEKENYCLVGFFLQANRTNLTLSNLQACTPIVRGQLPNVPN